VEFWDTRRGSGVLGYKTREWSFGIQDEGVLGYKTREFWDTRRGSFGIQDEGVLGYKTREWRSVSGSELLCFGFSVVVVVVVLWCGFR
jgi:hypothetical protein